VRLNRGVFGVLWVLALAWTFFCAWSFWLGERGPLESAYFGARDWIEPGGYSIQGRLRNAPTWGLFHLGCAVLPAAGLFLLRRIAGDGS